MKHSAKLPPFMLDTLMANETVVWVGKPEWWAMFKRHGPLLLYAVPWVAGCTYLLLDELGLLSESAGSSADFGLILIIPFLLLGIWLLRIVITDLVKPIRMTYVITNRRALEFVNLRTVTVKSYFAKELAFIETKINPNGSGDLIFARVSSTNTAETRKRHRISLRIGFFGVEDVRTAEQHLIKLVHDQP